MTKKKSAFIVEDDLSNLFGEVEQTSELSNDDLTIEEALEHIVNQMELSGLRPRTILDYRRYVAALAETCNIRLLNEINAQSIYTYLSSLKVANSTKLIRLKCIKAFLERCLGNGWIERPYWRDINIKVSTPVKKETSERDILYVLSSLDLSDFMQLRDAATILIIYQTGIRVRTAALLRESYVNFIELSIRIPGEDVKNHDSLVLPIDKRLASILSALIAQNEKVRRFNGVNNDYLFITKTGDNCLKTPTNNNLARRLNVYRKRFNLENFSAHAIRRAFAKSVYLRSGRDLALVSKALGHSDFAVTSRYLNLSSDEVAEELRKYL